MTGGQVGVVGDPAVADAAADASAAVVAGAVDDVLGADPDWVVAAGADALRSLAGAGLDRPVLAVDPPDGVPGVPADGVTDAVRAVLDGHVPVTTRRRVVANVDGERRAPFLQDAMLVTAEPARISEFAVATGDHRVAQFRADGVVVATPAGSVGYAAAVGGPVVEPGTGTLVVAPVAQFATASDHWVLDDDGVSLTVHRDEPVVLVADGVECGRVRSGSRVTLVPGGDLRLYAPDGDWKNSNGPRSE